MKKLLSVILSAILVVSFTACTKDKGGDTSSQPNSQTAENSQGGFKPNRNSQTGSSEKTGDEISEEILLDYWGVWNITDANGNSVKGEDEETYQFKKAGMGIYTAEKKVTSTKWKEETQELNWKIVNGNKLLVYLEDGSEYTGIYNRKESVIELDIGGGKTAYLMQVQPPLNTSAPTSTPEPTPAPTPYTPKHPEWTPSNLNGFWETLVDKYYQDYGIAYPQEGETIEVSFEYYDNAWVFHMVYDDGYEGGYTYYAKRMTYHEGAMYSGCPNSDWYMSANYTEYNTLILATYYNNSIEVAIGRIPENQTARYWTYYSVKK